MHPNEPLTRRQALRAGLTALAVPTVLSAAEAAGSLKFRLKEEAGLRRFGYPVHTLLPKVKGSKNFRLTRSGRPVPAQFRETVGLDGAPAVALDFSASPGPLESERYVVEHGKGIEPGPEPKGGMAIEHVSSTFRVTNGGSLAYVVPDNLLGFLKGVRGGKTEYLRELPDQGLYLRYRDDIHYRAGGFGPDGVPTRATIARQGPLAIGLRFESTEAVRGERSVASVVELTFPSSKSWVEATWTVTDPEGFIGGLGVDLPLRIDGNPTLVDLGARSTVYGTLKGRERMTLRAGHAPGLDNDEARAWRIHKGQPEILTTFAEEMATETEHPAEGWTHVMDSTRCTALAVADFGAATRDRIEVDADGRVQAWRDFAGGGALPAKSRKSFRFWLHFVPMPVQVGALTSPQAMLAPLRVEWDARPR